MRPGPAPVHEVQPKRFAICQKMIAEKVYSNTRRISGFEKIIFHGPLCAYVLIYFSHVSFLYFDMRIQNSYTLYYMHLHVTMF